MRLLSSFKTLAIVGVIIEFVVTLSSCLASDISERHYHDRNHHLDHNHNRHHRNHHNRSRNHDTSPYDWNPGNRGSVPMPFIPAVVGSAMQLIKMGLLCPSEAYGHEAAEMRAEILFYGVEGWDWPFSIQEVKGGNVQSAWNADDVDTLVRRKGFDLNIPTRIYVGGWKQAGKSERWIYAAREIRDLAWIENKHKNPFNFIVFDWVTYATTMYFPSAARVPHIGRVLGSFIHMLLARYRYRPELIHLVSFSLGTHVAGMAGRYILEQGQRLGQITAIDPTGFCFHQPIVKGSFGSNYGLRATDAIVVLARHYDMGWFGANQPIGGIDVYVNGGREQPGRQGKTSHDQGIEHEIDMMNRTQWGFCHDVAYRCSSRDDFDKGFCNDCSVTGNCLLLNSMIHLLDTSLTQPPLSYFPPNTSLYYSYDDKHYCLLTYQVVAKMNGYMSNALETKFTNGEIEFNVSNDRDVHVVRPRFKMDSGDGSKTFTELYQGGLKGIKGPYDITGLPNDLLDSFQLLAIKYMSTVSQYRINHMSSTYCPNRNAGGIRECGLNKKRRSRRKHSRRPKRL